MKVPALDTQFETKWHLEAKQGTISRDLSVQILFGATVAVMHLI